MLNPAVPCNSSMGRTWFRALASRAGRTRSGSMSDDRTDIIYNADCPVCRFEIDHYRKIAERDGLPLRFTGLDGAGAFGLEPEAAARRLHVMKDGRILTGVPAFLALWQAMPRLRWLAVVVGLPGIRQVAGLLYDRILAPALFRAHLRRQKRRA